MSAYSGFKNDTYRSVALYLLPSIRVIPVDSDQNRVMITVPIAVPTFTPCSTIPAWPASIPMMNSNAPPAIAVPANVKPLAAKERNWLFLNREVLQITFSDILESFEPVIVDSLHPKQAFFIHYFSTLVPEVVEPV